MNKRARRFLTLSASSLLVALGAPGRLVAAVPNQVAHGRLVTDSMRSRALGAWKRMVVYLPAQYDANTRTRFPVAYYLHGWSGDETNWSTVGHIAETADSLSAAGIGPMIIVMPDGDDSWYVTASTPNYAACASDSTRKEPATSYCVRSANYEQYITRELVHHVDSRYRTRPDARHRGIAGLSMGGFGAVTLALRYPRVFSAAASHSGILAPLYQPVKRDEPNPIPPASARTLRTAYGSPIYSSLERAFGPDTAGWWPSDPSRLTAHLVKHKRRVPALFVDVGVEDPYRVQSRIFHASLGHLGVSHEYHEWPGTHSWAYWRAHAAESLSWLAERIGT